MVLVQTNDAVSSRMVYRLVAFVYEVIAEVQAWNDKRQTVRLLERLDERELRDIGLTRGDVYRMARSTAF